MRTEYVERERESYVGHTLAQEGRQKEDIYNLHNYVANLNKCQEYPHESIFGAPEMNL
jgi:hypothetical protein